MLVALTSENHLTTAHRHLNKNADYFCPSCKTKVYLKIGQVLRPHFAHYTKENCDVFSEGETAEHIQGKMDIFQTLQNNGYQAQLEAYLPEIKQRPDILVDYQNKKWAIEFQCSAIPIQKIIERSAGYRQANYQVVWILGKQFRYQKKLTNLQKASLYYHLASQTIFLFHYVVETKNLIVHHNFQVNCKGNTTNETIKLKALTSPLRSLRSPSQKNTTDKNPESYFKQQHKKFLQATRYPSQLLMDFLALLYLHKDNIVTMPIELYQHVPSEWLIQTFPMNWKYQVLYWVESHAVGQIITRKSLRKWFNEARENRKIVLCPSQNLPEDFLLKPICEFMDYLATKKIMKKRKTFQWSYQQPARRYQTIEEKL